MKILLTGATGYIGKRLLPILLDRGHEVVCCVRNRERFPAYGKFTHPNISLLEVDFLKELPPSEGVKDIDAAYYLIHSMSAGTGDFAEMEAASARNFLKLIEPTSARQLIYLTGITNEKELSKHLSSRQNVEEILANSSVPLTAIKAGIIVGSGSASFEIMRDLVEKLPVMITPKWVTTKSQPIAIRNVLEYLEGVLLREDTFNKAFDIGGPDVLTYKEMLLQFAAVRGFTRKIITVPVMTPRLSSYWLYFVTSTSYKLAVNLVDSMKVEVIARNNELENMLGIHPIPYKEAVSLAFQKIEQSSVISSWKDSLASSYADNSLLEHINVPTDGCFVDHREKKISGSHERVLNNIWAIGGKRGWYYGSRLWKIRGFMDKMVGGVGLRRGRTDQHHINTGDTLDFWRVLAADEKNRRLLLYAEMKLPGEAWLEFKIIERNGEHFLHQTATFRPNGLAGRLYWYSVMPFHFFVFEGMAKNLVKFKEPGLQQKSG
ncbi:SDR family oxidoreductase [Salinimicrobium tongyeongense]|uniref:SDR family oxidoreductase n=1 Tax=Salinimicrobium tongyeongense TaxID=2809707 RepID=A0ABY6NSA6_9FLAO|nr:SDR family oxidoreductase [Salinimicrobium tongyeongense]UZH55718.1 SDR family oxidoreductase [Salinimicrobium tongyeongense]